MAQKVLVVDVGGTHLKILATDRQTPRKIRFGTKDDSRADVQLCAEGSKRLAVRRRRDRVSGIRGARQTHARTIQSG
jgi:hypothetical protein